MTTSIQEVLSLSHPVYYTNVATDEVIKIDKDGPNSYIVTSLIYPNQNLDLIITYVEYEHLLKELNFYWLQRAMVFTTENADNFIIIRNLLVSKESPRVVYTTKYSIKPIKAKVGTLINILNHKNLIGECT